MFSGILFWLCILAVFYVYAGYPLILGLLVKLFKHPVADSDVTPGVTLLIAAYNEEAVIAKKLENSLSLDYPRDRLQVLVAADGSDDRTVEIVQSFEKQGVELSFATGRRGKMSAINRAMEKARGEIVVFSDANNLYRPETLRQLVKPFADPQVGAVSGSKHVVGGDGSLGEAEGLYWKYESFIKRAESQLSSCTAFAGEIFALRRSLFMLPPAKVINDDFYMGLQVIRQGYRAIYRREAQSYEHVSETEKDEIERRTRIVAGRYQAISMSFSLLPFSQPMVVWQIISHKFLRPLVPFAMVGALLANLAALIWPYSAAPSLLFLSAPYNWIIFILQILFYALALFGRNRKGSGLGSKILYLPTYLVNSNLAALLGLLKYLTGKQTVIWKRATRRVEG
jgi:biofilm PGA synthesis N-glycosyltransferase PgaC